MSASDNPTFRASRVLALLVLLCIPIPGTAQDVEVAHRADSLDVTVQSRFRVEVRAPAEFTYEYDVTSALTSVQNVWIFAVRLAETGTISDLSSPNDVDWYVAFPFSTYGMDGPGRVLAWGGLGEKGRIRAGESLDGFTLETDLFPGISTFWLEGWTPLPDYENEAAMPDTVLGHTLYDNSVSGPVIGPIYPSSSVSDVRGTLAAMSAILGDACSVGWATKGEVCNELANQLNLALREANDGKTSAAARRTERFRTPSRA